MWKNTFSNFPSSSCKLKFKPIIFGHMRRSLLLPRLSTSPLTDAGGGQARSQCRQVSPPLVAAQTETLDVRAQIYSQYRFGIGMKNWETRNKIYGLEVLWKSIW